MKKLILLIIAVWLPLLASAQWVPSLNKPVICFYKNVTVIYAGTTSGGIYRTTNEGVAWRKIDRDSVPFVVNAIVSSGNSELLAGTSNGIFKAPINNDSTWVRSGLVGVNILSLSSYSSGLVLAGSTNGVYKSTNSGVTWDPIPQLGGRRINSISNTIYLIGTDQGLYRSTDNGGSWVIDAMVGTQYNINCVTHIGAWGQIVGHSTGYVYTTNGGVNWSSGGTMPAVYSIAGLSTTTPQTALFGYANGVLLATLDNTIHWVERNNGLPTAPVYAVQGKSNTNYVLAASSQQVYKSPLAYVPVITISTEVPAAYSLNQNYPNPFNPSTTINYSVPTKGVVKLKVYDALGRLLTTLIDAVQTPGTYAVSWDASEYTSGLYYYELQSENFKQTKRMLLIK